MITARTKRQLVIFLIITLVGVSYVGARYARLDRLFYDSSYTVTASLAQSGGIFTDAEVTYRGVQIGRVTDMRLTGEGVDVDLSIERDFADIPSETLALVGNRSAVGEQYVELQPQRDEGPYLEEGSTIAEPQTDTPVQTTELLTNLSNLVTSVPQSDLRTVVAEAGAAFQGTGDELAQIIETQNSFIEVADANFETTRRLIRDGRIVLQTQVDKESAIRSFARDLALFSGTVADSDADLRRVIEEGSATANELRTFLEQNEVNLGELINNLVTTNEVVTQYLPGIRQLLVIYPYVVAGGFTVTASQGDGNFNARFGLVITPDPPVCEAGYVPPRTPGQREDLPMPTEVGCTDGSTTLRGAEKAPGPSRTGTAYRSPVATYDMSRDDLTWAPEDQPEVVYDGGAAAVFGADSWKWMLTQPAMSDEQQ
jgi:phospholipid/cholesterol/gamma-HCH transport system substrate-binding protein